MGLCRSMRTCFYRYASSQVGCCLWRNVGASCDAIKQNIISMPTLKPTENIFAGTQQLPAPAHGMPERFEQIMTNPACRVERIVSYGNSSPPGFWYEQPEHEWVLILKGGAGLRIDGEATVRHLAVGDHVTLPAHCRHRVEYTSDDEETIWLAVFWHDASTPVLSSPASSVSPSSSFPST